MNPRYVLLVVGFLLILVGGLVGEGGPIDTVAKGDIRKDAGEPIAASAQASASAPSQGASDFFADYEPATDAMPEFLSAHADTGSDSGFGASARRSSSVGALSKEQLNVEEPVGLASMRNPVDVQMH